MAATEDQQVFRSSPDIADDDEIDVTDLTTDTKPRILLMGLRRLF